MVLFMQRRGQVTFLSVAEVPLPLVKEHVTLSCTTPTKKPMISHANMLTPYTT
jgi:hypothetical protein